MVRLPLMTFVGSKPEQFSCIVSWDGTLGLVCDCGTGDDGFPCLHVIYAETMRTQGIVFSDSADVPRSELEAMANDLPRLQDWMMKRLPVVDIDNNEWLQRVERSWMESN